MSQVGNEECVMGARTQVELALSLYDRDEGVLCSVPRQTRIDQMLMFKCNINKHNFLKLIITSNDIDITFAH